jgi:hypothetical protein
MLYRLHLVWARFELTTLVVIGIDCIVNQTLCEVHYQTNQTASLSFITLLRLGFEFHANIYEIWIKWLNPKLHILFGNQTSPKRRVWRYQRGNQNPYIEKEQTTQWPKEIVQREKQRSTKHTYKTKDRVTRTPLRTDWTHVLRKSKQFLLH